MKESRNREGCQFSALLANQYMNNFESNAVNSFDHKYTRMAQRNPNVKFTMEIKTNNSLNFLNVLIIKSNNLFTHTA